MTILKFESVENEANAGRQVSHLNLLALHLEKVAPLPPDVVEAKSRQQAMLQLPRGNAGG